jgi:hypothetical protein
VRIIFENHFLIFCGTKELQLQTTIPTTSVCLHWIVYISASGYIEEKSLILQ